MRSVIFRNSRPRQAFAKIAGALTPAAFVSRWAPVGVESIAEPVAPGSDWVECETVLTGICGSDSKQIFLNGARDNPMTALISFPHVLGHEAVARRLDTGELVVLNPWLWCEPRQITPLCPACEQGQYAECRNFGRGALPPSVHLGNCAAAPGTHGERFYAHRRQLHRIPEGVTIEQAVLADPVSVSLHSLLRNPPEPGLPALVYGCGALGLSAIALLRHLHPDLEVWAVSKYDHAALLAEDYGADAVFKPDPEALVAEVVSRTGATPLVPWSRKTWLQDGPGVIYDTVGSPQTVETSLRIVNTRGSVVISGVEPPKRFEWTPLYFKEINVIGSNAFGVELLGDQRKHAFDHYFDLVRDGFDVTAMITHRFALEDWRKAVLTIARRKRTRSVKVLLEPMQPHR